MVLDEGKHSKGPDETKHDKPKTKKASYKFHKYDQGALWASGKARRAAHRVARPLVVPEEMARKKEKCKRQLKSLCRLGTHRHPMRVLINRDKDTKDCRALLAKKGDYVACKKTSKGTGFYEKTKPRWNPRKGRKLGPYRKRPKTEVVREGKMGV